MANEVEIVVKTVDKSKGPIDQAENRINKLGESTKRVGGYMAAAFAGAVIAGGVQKLTGFIGESITAASDLGESMNAVTKIFGSQSKVIMDWGKTNATSYGLSQRAFQQMATPLGAMLKNAGLSMSQVSGKTIDLTKRAADMASVFNTTVPEALEAIQAGLRGESDPLEQFGVGLSAAAVETRALAMTHKDAAKDLKTSELALARIDLIMKQTNTSAGDFTSTSGQLANAQRIATAKTEELQATIGAKLIPVMLTVTQAKLALTEVLVGKLIPAMEKVGAYFKEHPAHLKALAIVVGITLVTAFTAWAVSATAAAVATIAATWPILLIIAAIAVLAAGLIYAYTHFEGFRKVADATGRWLRDVLWPIIVWIAKTFKEDLTNGLHLAREGFLIFLKVVLTVMHAAAKAAAIAFGWIPGLGPKLRESEKRMASFVSAINGYLSKIRDKTVNVTVKINGQTANIRDTGTRVSVSSGGRTVYAYAHGGVIPGQAAGGGPRSGPVLVGENGPELVDLSPGSRVHSNPDTERMMSAGGAQKVEGTLRLVLDSGKNRDFLAWLASTVRENGGWRVVFGE